MISTHPRGHSAFFDGPLDDEQKRWMKVRQRRAQGQLLQAPTEVLLQRKWPLCDTSRMSIRQSATFHMARSAVGGRDETRIYRKRSRLSLRAINAF
jgi:hypothetical protein